MKDLLKDGTMFLITYTPQTIGGVPNHDKKHITRRGKWDMKCKLNENYILYFDRDRSNYRCASNKLSPIHISIGLNKEEMRVIQ